MEEEYFLKKLGSPSSLRVISPLLQVFQCFGYIYVKLRAVKNVLENKNKEVYGGIIL